jgi:dihydrofolate reductase
MDHQADDSAQQRSSNIRRTCAPVIGTAKRWFASNADTDGRDMLRTVQGAPGHTTGTKVTTRPQPPEQAAGRAAKRTWQRSQATAVRPKPPATCDEGTELHRVMQEMPDDEQQDEYFVSRLRQVGTHIMGRVTYEGMAEFWPKFDNPVAGAMNDIPKVVFSRTLRSAGWPESRIASGDTAEEIARLKAEPGREIVAHGGVEFARSLIRLGLVDRRRGRRRPECGVIGDDAGEAGLAAALGSHEHTVHSRGCS